MKILVINPGSTSTKVALYENEEELISKNLPMDMDAIKNMTSLYDQLDLRTQLVEAFLREQNLPEDGLDVVVSRGGMLPPVGTGGYIIDNHMVDVLRNHPAQIHASNLGALIANKIALEKGIPAYIYDPVSVDELSDIARFSGIKGRDRNSYTHVLNTRAMALRYCKENGKDYQNATIICAHLGGGISLNLQHKGRIIDIISAEEGPFSSERAGGLQIFTVGEIVKEEGLPALYKYEGGKGGLISYLGTNDARKTEEMIESGDEYAKKVYRAMAYQIAKSIGSLAVPTAGKVDTILLTGGLAHSDLLTQWVQEYVDWIAPVTVYAGEFEMKALAQGAFRIMSRQEEARRL